LNARPNGSRGDWFQTPWLTRVNVCGEAYSSAGKPQASQQRLSAISEGTVMPQNKKRVLVLEDEAFIAIMLEDMLTASGYQVIGPVENLKSAIHLAASEQIDFAVVDINIDGHVADKVADELMERRIPFLFVSGQEKKLGLRYGAIPLLRKPFLPEDLSEAVARLMAERDDQGG
jgi:CheY-like chemotaxis protein